MRYLLIPFFIVSVAFAQQAVAPSTPAQPAERVFPAPLFFREELKSVPVRGEHGGEHAVTQDSIANPNLELKLYGASGKDIQVVGTVGDAGNPVRLWTGLCTSPIAVAFRDRNGYVDLTGLAKIRWMTRVSGFHQMRPAVKLADGTWLVGDQAVGSISDYQISEISISDVRWLKLDVDRVVTKGNWVQRPDLTKVDEIGFADLMPASGHGQGGWSLLSWIEVYGKTIKREGGSTASR